MANRYTDEQKQAVIDAIALGESVREVARKFDIAPATVHVWATGARQAVSNTLNKDTLGALALDYLRENLETLSAQARYFRSDDFLKTNARADAHGLGVLHGIIADKAIRVFAVANGSTDASG